MTSCMTSSLPHMGHICAFLMVVAVTTSVKGETLVIRDARAPPPVRPGAASASSAWVYSVVSLPGPSTWRQARSACEALPGGILAHVTDKETQGVVRRLLPEEVGKNESVWVAQRQPLGDVVKDEKEYLPAETSSGGTMAPHRNVAAVSGASAGLTLHCLTMRAAEGEDGGLSYQLCNRPGPKAAVCTQRLATQRPFAAECPPSPSMPWLVLRSGPQQVVHDDDDDNSDSMDAETSVGALLQEDNNGTARFNRSVFLFALYTCRDDVVVEVECDTKMGWLRPECPYKTSPPLRRGTLTEKIPLALAPKSPKTKTSLLHTWTKSVSGERSHKDHGVRRRSAPGSSEENETWRTAAVAQGSDSLDTIEAIMRGTFGPRKPKKRRKNKKAKTTTTATTSTTTVTPPRVTMVLSSSLPSEDTNSVPVVDTVTAAPTKPKPGDEAPEGGSQGTSSSGNTGGQGKGEASVVPIDFSAFPKFDPTPRSSGGDRFETVVLTPMITVEDEDQGSLNTIEKSGKPVKPEDVKKLVTASGPRGEGRQPRTSLGAPAEGVIEGGGDGSKADERPNEESKPDAEGGEESTKDQKTEEDPQAEGEPQAEGSSQPEGAAKADGEVQADGEANPELQVEGEPHIEEESKTGGGPQAGEPQTQGDPMDKENTIAEGDTQAENQSKSDEDTMPEEYSVDEGEPRAEVVRLKTSTEVPGVAVVVPREFGGTELTVEGERNLGDMPEGQTEPEKVVEEGRKEMAKPEPEAGLGETEPEEVVEESRKEMDKPEPEAGPEETEPEEVVEESREEMDKPEAEAGPDTLAEVKTEPEKEIEAGLEKEAAVEAGTSPKRETDLELKAEPEAESEVLSKGEPQTETRVISESELVAEPEPLGDAKPMLEPEPETPVSPEAPPGFETSVEPETPTEPELLFVPEGPAEPRTPTKQKTGDGSETLTESKTPEESQEQRKPKGGGGVKASPEEVPETKSEGETDIQPKDKESGTTTLGLTEPSPLAATPNGSAGGKAGPDSSGVPESGSPDADPRELSFPFNLGPRDAEAMKEDVMALPDSDGGKDGGAQDPATGVDEPPSNDSGKGDSDGGGTNAETPGASGDSTGGGTEEELDDGSDAEVIVGEREKEDTKSSESLAKEANNNEEEIGEKETGESQTGEENEEEETGEEARNTDESRQRPEKTHKSGKPALVSAITSSIFG